MARKTPGCATLLGFFLLSALLPKPPEEKAQESPDVPVVQEEKRDEALQKFALAKAPELYRAWDDLARLEVEIERRTHELHRILDQYDRAPEEDEDLSNWLEELRGVRQAKFALRKDLIDAYLLFTKYRLSPSSDVKAEMQVLLDRGRVSAQEAQERYQDLRNRLGSEGSS